MITSAQFRSADPTRVTDDLSGAAEALPVESEPRTDSQRPKTSHPRQHDPKKTKDERFEFYNVPPYHNLSETKRSCIEQALQVRGIDVKDPSFLCLPDEYGHLNPMQQYHNLEALIRNLDEPGSMARAVDLLTNIMASPHFTPLQKIFFCCGRFKPDEVLTIFLEARKNPRNRVWIDDVLKDLTLRDYEHQDAKYLGNPDALWGQVYQELVRIGFTDFVDGLDITRPNWMGILERIIDRQIDIYNQMPNRDNAKPIWWLMDEWLKANDHVKPAWQVLMDQTLDTPHELRELSKASLMNLTFFLSDQRGLDSKEKRLAIARDMMTEELRWKIASAQTCSGVGAVRSEDFHWATINSIARKIGLEAVIAKFDDDSDFAVALAKKSYADYEARALLAAIYPHRPDAVLQALGMVYDDNEKLAKAGVGHFYSLIPDLLGSYPYKDDDERMDEQRAWANVNGRLPDSKSLDRALERIKNCVKRIEILQRGLQNGNGSSANLPNLFLGFACDYLEIHGLFPRPHSGPKEFGLGMLVDKMARKYGMDRKLILADLLPDTTIVTLPETKEEIELRGTGARASRFEFFKEEDREVQIFQKVLSIFKYSDNVDGVEKTTDLVKVSASDKSPFSDSVSLPVFQVTRSAPNVHMPRMLVESIDLQINGGRLRSEVVHGLLTPAEETKLDETLTVTSVDSDQDHDGKFPVPSYGKRAGAIYSPDKAIVAVPTTNGIASAQIGALAEQFLPSSFASALLDRDREQHYDAQVLDSWERYYASIDKGFDGALALEIDQNTVVALLPKEKFKTPRQAINFVIGFIRENLAYDHDLDDDITHQQFQDDYQRGQLSANELWNHLFNPQRKTHKGKVRAQCREIAFIATQLLRATGIITAYQNGRLVKSNGRTTKLGHTHPAVIVSGKDNKPRIAFFHFAAGETIGTAPFTEDDADETGPNLWPLGIAAGTFGLTTFSGLGLGVSSLANEFFPMTAESTIDTTVTTITTVALGLTAVAMAATAIGALVLSQRHRERGNDDQTHEEEVCLEKSGMTIPLKVKRGTLEQVSTFINRYRYLTDPTLHRYLSDPYHSGLPSSLDQTLASFFPRRIVVSETNRTSALSTPEFVRRNTIRRRDEMARLLEGATRPLTDEERAEIAREIAQLEYEKEKINLIGNILQRKIETLREILRQGSLLNAQAAQILQSFIEQDRNRPEDWLPEVIV